MRKLILISTMFLTSFVYSQKPMVVSEEICMPVSVAKKVMMDLNRMDSLSAVLELEKSENFELRKKIDLQNNILGSLELKNEMIQQNVSMSDEKFQIVDNINKDLTTEIKRLKRKNTIIEIVSGVLISGLTYGIIMK